MSLRLFGQTKRSVIQPCEGDFQILDGKMQNDGIAIDAWSEFSGVIQ